MKTEEIFKHVEESVREVLNTDEGEIKKESKIITELGAESIDFLDIACELEQAIDYEIDFKDVLSSVQKVKGDDAEMTIADIVNYIENLKL